MKDYSNYRTPPKESLMWSARKIFEEQLNENGVDILIDHMSTKGIIETHTNPLNEHKEDRKLKVLDSTLVNRGSLIKYNSEDWLVITKPKSNQIYKITKIYECNNKFKWQDKNLDIHSSPVLILDKTSVYSDGLNVSRFITLTDDQILITIPNTPHTKQLKIDKRIMFNNDIDNVYKITKIQDLVHEGLIYITMSRSEYNSANDNVELGICDYVAVTPPQEPIPIGYSIVVNGDNTINRSGSKTYNAKVYADGEEVFDKTVVWSLNNSNASITSSTGLSCIVKGLVIGNVVLKAELSDDTSVFGEKTIQITGLF